jgi:hypothetical protein
VAAFPGVDPRSARLLRGPRRGRDLVCRVNLGASPVRSGVTLSLSSVEFIRRGVWFVVGPRWFAPGKLDRQPQHGERNRGDDQLIPAASGAVSKHNHQLKG